MDMKVAKRRLAFSLLVGLVVTTMTGALANTAITGSIPDLNTGMDPNGSYWGYLFPWMRNTPASVKAVLWKNFIVDVMLWTAFAFLVFTVANVPRAPSRVQRPKRKKKR
jgi:hypothetical protein